MMVATCESQIATLSRTCLAHSYSVALAISFSFARNCQELLFQVLAGLPSSVDSLAVQSLRTEGAKMRKSYRSHLTKMFREAEAICAEARATGMPIDEVT